MAGNLGTTDRVVRIALGAGMVGLGLLRGRTWMSIAGLYPLATGLAGTCPAYKAMGISSRKTYPEDMLEEYQEEAVEVAVP